MELAIEFNFDGQEQTYEVFVNETNNAESRGIKNVPTVLKIPNEDLMTISCTVIYRCNCDGDTAELDLITNAINAVRNADPAVYNNLNYGVVDGTV